jgi:hypothetical protein
MLPSGRSPCCTRQKREAVRHIRGTNRNAGVPDLTGSWIGEGRLYLVERLGGEL